MDERERMFGLDMMPAGRAAFKLPGAAEPDLRDRKSATDLAQYMMPVETPKGPETGFEGCMAMVA